MIDIIEKGFFCVEVKGRRFVRFKSIVRVLLESEEITVEYITFPKKPNKLCEVLKEPSGYKYINKFDVDNICKVRIKYLYFRYASIGQKIFIVHLLLFCFIVLIKHIISFNFEYLIRNGVLCILVLMLMIYLTAIKVIEITLKNRTRIFIPVYAYKNKVDYKTKKDIEQFYNEIKSYENNIIDEQM